MPIDSAFECGNIVVQSETIADAALTIRPDTNADYFQWFYFKDTPQIGVEKTYRIYNASSASYPAAWAEYDALASYDEVTWFRVPSQYDGTHFMWTLKPEQNSVSFVFFPPYRAQRRADLIAEVSGQSHVTHRELGKTLEDRPLDLLVFGDEARTDVKQIWIIGRQHAGEPMAEFATEGMIRRLADEADSVVQKVLEQATVYIVPNTNPDGSAAGNLRANPAGIDLNRAWHARDRNTPEITCILYAMQDKGVDYFLDIHGDEARPYLWFISPGNPQHMHVQKGFEAHLAQTFKEIQPPPSEIIEGVMPEKGLAINHIAKLYDCPAWVVELPFKVTPVGDTLLEEGCMKFGSTCVDGLVYLLEGE